MSMSLAEQRELAALREQVARNHLEAHTRMNALHQLIEELQDKIAAKPGKGAK